MELNLHPIYPHRQYSINHTDDPTINSFYGKIKASKYADRIVPLDYAIDDGGFDEGMMSVVELLEKGVGLEQYMDNNYVLLDDLTVTVRTPQNSTDKIPLVLKSS